MRSSLSSLQVSKVQGPFKSGHSRSRDKNDVCFDVLVAKLHLLALGAEIIVLTQEHSASRVPKRLLRLGCPLRLRRAVHRSDQFEEGSYASCAGTPCCNSAPPLNVVGQFDFCLRASGLRTCSSVVANDEGPSRPFRAKSSRNSSRHCTFPLSMRCSPSLSGNMQTILVSRLKALSRVNTNVVEL